MKNSEASESLTPRSSSAALRSLCEAKSAFTLIELMAVMTIIAILAGLVIGIASYAQRSAAEKQAKAEIKSMESAIESFKLDNGYYPTSSIARCVAPTDAVINSWLLYQQIGQGSNPAGKIYFPFSPKQIQVVSTNTFPCIVDPFGNAYGYFCQTASYNSSQTNKVSFDLWSFGADGVAGTADDINNW